MPVRIQRKRTKGWRMPSGAVYVGRGSHWGNPYRVTEQQEPRVAADKYRDLFEGRPSRSRHLLLRIASDGKARGELHWSDMRARLGELRGKDLACWCALDAPCHADVLLELANK